MNAEEWIERFEGNRAGLEVDWEAPVRLPARVRRPLAKSLAVFQLGETGDGGTLRRYARRTRDWPGFERYEEALDLFIREENRHARDLARMVERLGGELLSSQWTATVFRGLRRPLGLRFELQILLTAELVAEAYYELLRRSVDDGCIKEACARMVRDEVGHLAFHADLFGAVQRDWGWAARMLWRVQFEGIHRLTSLVVWWDHRPCFRALGIPWRDYRRLCRRARENFLGRIRRGRVARPARQRPIRDQEERGVA